MKKIKYFTVGVLTLILISACEKIQLEYTCTCKQVGKPDLERVFDNKEEAVEECAKKEEDLNFWSGNNYQCEVK